MRKSLFLTLIIVIVIAPLAIGDTIRLKNGSVLKGKVTSFADDQFIVMLDTGSGRYISKAIVYMGDVAKIDFDSAGSASDAGTAPAQTSEAPARGTVADPPPRTTKGRKGAANDTASRNTQPPADPQPRDTGPPPETQPPPVPVRETVQSDTEKPAAANPTGNPPSSSESADSERLGKKQPSALKTLNVDVVAKKDWTSSGLIVKRGDHLRVTASGAITLDPGTGRTCGPEGLSDLTDPKKLMPEHPTGALIGVISSDNDDFIFIGRSSEFTAMRDGLLFLSVNEGVLSDNLGAFKAVVEVLSQRK